VLASATMCRAAENTTLVSDSLAQSRAQQLKLLRQLVSLSYLLSLINSPTSAAIADKDGSIKASDGETAGPLHSCTRSASASSAALLQDLSCTSCSRSRRPTRNSDRATQRRTSVRHPGEEAA
jgi:hypothetical protein